ncbi:metalloregulator ArsR/SmtB family transcription factor [Bacillus carboniphilus]|uniref:Metalloregulator ArsR/SmtB family transcription factor n=1 Tax=Bacillus carboniphilus TaxID=86663 RepID=A0ABY9JZT7_9BACI|nr:metalloregulator ArsR/SmtB family transcription factor [Bacillus carboniphilus]WLR43115.1 metalloregulator ArsR/SmtB family transcription factor [Bacillus carboniphilus]
MTEEVIDVFRSCIPLLQTLSDPARQDIIVLLVRHHTLTVNEITNHSTLSRPAISHHLKILRDNGLVTIEQKGTQRFYSLQLTDAIERMKRLITTVEGAC